MNVEPPVQAYATHLDGNHPIDEYLDIAEVMRIAKASHSSIYSWIKKGIFPRQRQIGPRAVRWRTSEVSRWSAEREVV